MWQLVDLSPTFWLLLVFIAVACVPLAWLWRAQRGQSSAHKLAALAALLVTLTFELTVFGAFTRLTDSGLGCPDWPGCYGTASPVHAQAEISAAQAAAPYGPVTHKKAWIEMVHRYFAGAVGFLIIVQLVWSWRQRALLPYALAWCTASLVWVIVQGLFGKFTVTMKLFPLIVSLHLLGALGLLMLLQFQRTRWRVALGQVPVLTGQPYLRMALCGALAFLLLQIALGAWVSTNYAVLACTTWPLCHGQWWPQSDMANGFTLWRHLHETASGSALPAAAYTAIHLVHRWVAVPVVAALLALAWALRRLDTPSSRWLTALVLAQFATGLSNVVLGWPLFAALLHTAGAALLVLLLTALWVRTYPVPAAKI